MLILILKFLLCIYGGSAISFVISLPLYFHLLEKKKKQLGFVNVRDSSFEIFLSTFEEEHNDKNRTLSLFVLLVWTLLPGFNLVPLIGLINFKKDSDKDIASELEDGNIVLKEDAPKDEAEGINLDEKISFGENRNDQLNQKLHMLQKKLKENSESLDCQFKKSDQTGDELTEPICEKTDNEQTQEQFNELKAHLDKYFEDVANGRLMDDEAPLADENVFTYEELYDSFSDDKGLHLK